MRQLAGSLLVAGEGAVRESRRLLAATRLRMELALGCDAPQLGAIADVVRALGCDAPQLGAIADVVRADPVATARLYALFARGLDDATEMPRAEELIAHLGRAELLEVVCQRPWAGDVVAAAQSEQACALGRMCRAVAETTGLPREMAFLVGLLAGSGEGAGLPWALGKAVAAVEAGEMGSPWVALVGAAEELLAARGVGVREF